MNKSKHSCLSDREFASQFENLSLPPTWFNHEAHLRLAHIMIQQIGIDAAEKKMCAQIKAFDVHHGDGQKFHRTITIAAVRTVDHFIRKSPESSFKDLLIKFPRLENNFLELLETHYSRERLSDPKAKLELLEPDKLPYDS